MMREMIVKYEQTALRMQESERLQITEALAGHTSMPPNYWQERWRSEQRLIAARALAEELERA